MCGKEADGRREDGGEVWVVSTERVQKPGTESGRGDDEGREGEGEKDQKGGPPTEGPEGRFVAIRGTPGVY